MHVTPHTGRTSRSNPSGADRKCRPHPLLTGAIVDEQDEFEDLADQQMSYCDCCGIAVRARMYVALPSGGVLLMCFHHANRHVKALNGMGAYLYELSA